jgi:hypothetical protein
MRERRPLALAEGSKGGGAVEKKRGPLPFERGGAPRLQRDISIRLSVAFV